ncbi:MAG: lysophospholipase [Saprospiraceae bacterium]|nr:lysophospholipase [Saprospiraceae bacterium]
MQQSIDFQQNNALGISVHYRHWPLANAKAVVCLVHGMGEHIGRYGHVAKYFAENGFATIGFDHQGHGQTTGKRGHSEGLESMLDDITNLLHKAMELHPGQPIFLYGHSMGGNLVLNHALRRKSAITGAIATAPWIRLPNPPSPFLIGFAKIMCRIAPKLTQPNGLDVNGLSNDAKVIEAYNADPLVHDRVSVKLGVELLNGANWLNKFEGSAPCPTLLMHGENDPITSPEASAELAKRMKGNVTLKLWSGLKHEIHNEPQQGEVLSYLVEWMKRFL